jgi:hypothetical protein
VFFQKPKCFANHLGGRVVPARLYRGTNEPFQFGRQRNVHMVTPLFHRIAGLDQRVDVLDQLIGEDDVVCVSCVDLLATGPIVRFQGGIGMFAVCISHLRILLLPDGRFDSITNELSAFSFN